MDVDKCHVLRRYFIRSMELCLGVLQQISCSLDVMRGADVRVQLTCRFKDHTEYDHQEHQDSRCQ